MKWSKDTLEMLCRLAENWNSGVGVIFIEDGASTEPSEVTALAVKEFTPYDPSNHIHHSVITGHDVERLVLQRLQITDPTQWSLEQYIETLPVRTWHLSHSCKWFWIKSPFYERSTPRHR